MRADAAQRRRRILTHARHLFAEQGSGVSLEVIAAASGVGIATLYRNFADREALTAAVMLDLLADIETAVSDATNAVAPGGASDVAHLPGSGTPPGGPEAGTWASSARGATASEAADTWERLVRRLVGLEVGALTDALGRSGASRPAEVTAAQHRTLAALTETMRPLVAAGAVRADLSALELVAAVGILTRPQPEEIRRAAPEIVDHLVDAFLAWSRPPH